MSRARRGVLQELWTNGRFKARGPGRGGQRQDPSQLDAHYRTMVWTLAAWVGALGAGILTLILTVRRLRSG